MKLGDHQVDFLTWADQYVNQLDPLHPEPRHPDMQPDDEKSYYRANADETDLRTALIRLTGTHWYSHAKLPTDAAGAPETGPGDDDMELDYDE